MVKGRCSRPQIHGQQGAGRQDRESAQANRRSDASKGYRDRLVAQTRAKEASIRKEGLRQKQVAEPPTALSRERWRVSVRRMTISFARPQFPPASSGMPFGWALALRSNVYRPVPSSAAISLPLPTSVPSSRIRSTSPQIRFLAVNMTVTNVRRFRKRTITGGISFPEIISR